MNVRTLRCGAFPSFSGALIGRAARRFAHSAPASSVNRSPIITYLGWFWMIAHYRAGELSAFTFLTPIFGVAVGRFLLGDVIAPGFCGRCGAGRRAVSCW